MILLFLVLSVPCWGAHSSSSQSAVAAKAAVLLGMSPQDAASVALLHPTPVDTPHNRRPSTPHAIFGFEPSPLALQRFLEDRKKLYEQVPEMYGDDVVETDSVNSHDVIETRCIRRDPTTGIILEVILDKIVTVDSTQKEETIMHSPLRPMIALPAVKESSKEDSELDIK